LRAFQDNPRPINIRRDNVTRVPKRKRCSGVDDDINTLKGFVNRFWVANIAFDEVNLPFPTFRKWFALKSDIRQGQSRQCPAERLGARPSATCEPYEARKSLLHPL
jgi:hypothetical protein